MRRPLLWVLTLLAAWAGTAGAAPHPLTLDEALRRAVRKNDALVIERESLTAAAAGVSGARGAYDPVLELEGSWTRSTEPLNSSFSSASPDDIAPKAESSGGRLSIDQRLPTGGAVSITARGARETTDGALSLLSPAYGTQVGVELRQPLLRHRAIDGARRSVRVAGAEHRAAVASLRRTLSETLATVEQAYWSLAAAVQAVEVRALAVGLAEEQLEQTRTRVQGGATPGTELAQPRAELARRHGEWLAARETAARLENRLKVLILGDADDTLWETPIVPADSAAVPVTPLDVEAAVDRALSVRPELDVEAARIDRRRVEAAFARNARWPALDAVVSYDRFGLAGTRNPATPGAVIPTRLDGNLDRSLETLGDGDFNAARVALVLGLPIRNREARAAAVVAGTAVRQAEAERSRLRKAIRAEVLDAAATLETAGQRIEAAHAGREAAEIQLAAEQDRYTSGLSTNFLVLTRQNDLSRARLDEISALTDYRMARTEMARATGSLIEERKHDVELGTR